MDVYSELSCSCCVLVRAVEGGGAGKVAGSGTCLSSRSPILRTVKLVSLSSRRPSFLRLSSSDRKLECHSISWSRQGKMVWTTPASSITSSCIPRRYTPSMILNVRTWWNSVWSNSERQRRDKRHCETNSCPTLGDIYGLVTPPTKRNK